MEKIVSSEYFLQSIDDVEISLRQQRIFIFVINKDNHPHLYLENALFAAGLTAYRNFGVMRAYPISILHMPE